MKVTIYANFGVLAHEYQIIYTATAPHRHAKVAEQVTVEIPDEYQPYETATGEVALSLPGMSWTYLLSEVLGSMDRLPAITWFDGQHTHRKMLRVAEGADRL